MSNLDYKSFSERRRPHIHPAGATLFVTYRLVDSIPQPVVRRYKAKKEWLESELKRSRKMAIGSQASELKERLYRIKEFHREWFLKFEDILHKAESGPMWLKDDRVAAKIAENLQRLDGDAYRLGAYCVMSNHVHTVFTPRLSEAELQESFDERGHLTFLSEHPGLSQIMQLAERTRRKRVQPNPVSQGPIL